MADRLSFESFELGELAEDDLELDETSPVRHDVDWHPGKGKTRNCIVKICKKKIQRRERTVVLTPTRVVNKEVESVLQEHHIPFSGRAGGISMNLVTVICHATFYDWALKRPEAWGKIRNVVMDEAHFLDPKSIAVRGMLDHCNAKYGMNVWYLTATPPGVLGEVGSNYPIDDKPHPNLEDDKELLNLLDQFDHRSVVFVESATRADRLCRKLSGSVSLHRKNFEVLYPRIKTEKIDTIFTTDISEMGANYDAEVVIDTCKVRKPVLTWNDEVILETKDISWASKNQRRGRVGRRSEGICYYNEKWVPNQRSDEDVCWVEARILLDLLGVIHGSREEEKNFRTTAGQFHMTPEQTTRFMRLVSSQDFDIPVLLAWKVAVKEVDYTDWIFSGTAEHVGPPVESGSFKGYEVKPRYWDDRFFGKQERPNLVAYLEKTKKMRSVFTTALFTQVSLNLVTNWVITNFNEASSLWMNDHLNSRQSAKAWGAFFSLAPLTIMVAMIVLWVIRRALGLTPCPLQQYRDRPIVINSSLVFGVLLLAYMWYIAVPPVIIILCTMFFVVYVPASTNENKFRSVIDDRILYFLIILLLVCVAIASYELQLMPRVENLFRSRIVQAAGPPDVEFSYSFGRRVPVLAATYVFMIAIFEPLKNRVDVNKCRR